MPDTVKEKVPTPAPAKQKIRLVLTGAGSYNDLNLKLGVLRKGDVIEIENDVAKRLISTGLFQKV